MRSTPSYRLRFNYGHCLIACLVSAGSIGAQQMNASHGHAPAKPSTALLVATPEGQISMSLADLKALPLTSVTVHNAHSNKDEHYSGAKLTDLLAKAGAKPGKGTLHSYLTATGTDGYWVLYSGEEISDVVHTGSVIVAITEDDKPLQGDGAFKLISTEDRKPERWVRNLEAVRLREASE